jgi:hypothetical protein
MHPIKCEVRKNRILRDALQRGDAASATAAFSFRPDLILPIKRSNPSRMASGRGGQPGMNKSTGTTSVAPFWTSA